MWFSKNIFHIKKKPSNPLEIRSPMELHTVVEAETIVKDMDNLTSYQFWAKYIPGDPWNGRKAVVIRKTIRDYVGRVPNHYDASCRELLARRNKQ